MLNAESLEGLVREFSDLLFAYGLRSPQSTIAVIAFKETLSKLEIKG